MDQKSLPSDAFHQEARGSGESIGPPKGQKKKLAEYVNIQSAMRRNLKNANLRDPFRKIPTLDTMGDESGPLGKIKPQLAVAKEGEVIQID